MSVFKKWLRQRRLQEDEDRGLGDEGPMNRDAPIDYERTQQELCKLLMSKYPTETQQLIDGIAQRDMEVKTLWQKLQQDQGPKQFEKQRHPTDGHEVVPSLPDSGKSDISAD